MASRGKTRRCAATAIAVALVVVPHNGFAEAPSAPVPGADEPMITAPPRQDVPAQQAKNRINTSGQPIQLVVPLRERGPLGQVTVIIQPDDTIRVRADDLVGVLSRIITPSATASLRSVADGDGFITPSAAETVGFGLTFDGGMLDLVVTIPLEARQRQSLGLGFSSIGQPVNVTDDPQAFSAYLNYRASVDYIHQSQQGLDDGLQSPRLDLDLNGTIGPVAFENLFTIDGDADESFQRNASRLIYDHEASATRWTLGDVQPDGSSFQSVPDMAGLSVSRLYTLSPYDRIVATRSSRSITLREPSIVEIRVNGIATRTIRLDAGTYDLRDLPLTQGSNAVEIVVENDAGAREIIAYDFFSDANLLGPGTDEFFFSGGVKANRQGGIIEYEEEPVFSGFYRRGLTEQLTVGGNFQTDDVSQLLGAEIVYGTRLGLSSLDIAASESDLMGSGYAIRFEQRAFRSIENLPGRETFDFSYEHRSERFGAIESFANNAYSDLLAVRYSRPLSQTVTASIGGDYAVARGGFEDRYGASAFASWRLDYDTNINFGATYNSNALSGEETNIFFNLTRRFGVRTTVTAGAESRNGIVRAGISRAAERSLNDVALSADVSRTDEAVGLSGSATYYTNRGDFELDHQTVFGEATGEIDYQQTAVRAYGAIGLAGNRFGIGRRIYDSFALVDGHSSLGGRDVLIRGVEALEESARSGPLGPALVPIGSYYKQTVPYDVENLPLGYDLGSGIFELMPRFHSGYALTVGSAYNVTASGVMLDAEGRPLSLRSGTAVSLDDPDAPRADVVTNRIGRFAISGLSQGRWRVTIIGESPLVYDIVVPSDTLFRVGTISPSTGGTSQ